MDLWMVGMQAKNKHNKAIFFIICKATGGVNPSA
jgi:hypothetical protein